MHRWCGQARFARACSALACFALACSALAGCAEQRASITQADAMDQLRIGAPILNCREACLAGWRSVQSEAAQLAAAARWPELAALVIGIGYQDDLSLYYLGQAAEGLGYPGAAASYYRQSTYISGTSQSCEHQSRVCGGLVFPQAALSLIAAMDRELDRARPRRAAPAPPAPVSRMPVLPAPPAASADAPPPGEPPPPHPIRSGPAPSEYIEPPPAPAVNRPL